MEMSLQFFHTFGKKVDILRAENIRTLTKDEDEVYDYGDDFDANFKG